MDSQESEEQFEQEPQESILNESTDQPQADSVDSARVDEPVQETEAAQPVEDESMDEAPVAEESKPASPSRPKSGQPEESEVPPESTEPAWFVIHCYSGYENKVRHNLEQRIETMGMKDRIFDVVIPT